MRSFIRLTCRFLLELAHFFLLQASISIAQLWGPTPGTVLEVPERDIMLLV